MMVFAQPISPETKRVITWCPGCGNYSIFKAFTTAIKELGIEPWRVVVITGIGCHGKLTDYVATNSIHTLHGRVPPLATAIKLVNPDLVVIGFAGDGDAYGIGAGHLPHVIRRNVDIKLFVHNNKIYGLTTGQASPTTDKGQITRTTPWGNIEEPINPIAWAISLGASFVARGFAGDIEHLKWLMKEAIKHKGFAIIDILQPCVTFDRIHTYQWYRERIYKLEEEGHDPTNWVEAMKKAYEWGERIPIGIFYRVRKPTFEELMPTIKDKPPIVFRPLKTTIRDLLERRHSLSK
ncbi:2-oxoacid:ferredoxin oxidoreductase subunit beta [Desulfurococcaceae archaeon MEX13E-LK6-19]|nr:2-oxoacid:ferredoxin oxidoreductase subunit beta [Desulfurococcaceae archaeon MEX13E-LK6-19]